ncbi:glutamic acid-rich protein-like, partial [Trifolium pratense]
MAGRGGWGRGGGFQRYVPPVPFVLFPEDINLPDAKPAEIDRYTMKLLKWDNQFNSYFKAAAYYLEEKEEVKGRKRMHVETYSDKKKKKNFTRDSLSQVLHFEGFAKELIPDMTQKKFFEELEKKLKEEGKHKGEEEGEEESEDEDENEEEDQESEGDFNDGDYNQNDYVDDDEDDYNDVEPGY